MEATQTAVRPLGDAREHYWLALGMAQTVGLDLHAEIQAGRFSLAAWADTVQCCRGCDWAGECPSWMAENGDAERAPASCVNSERFNALLGIPAAAQPASAPTAQAD